MHTEHLLGQTAVRTQCPLHALCLSIAVPMVGLEEMQARGRDPKTQSSQRCRQGRNMEQGADGDTVMTGGLWLWKHIFNEN